MESLGALVLTKLYKVTFDIFRRRFVQSIQDGNVNLAFIKESLQSEFDVVTSQLDKVIKQPLVEAQVYITSGLTALANEQPDAQMFFMNADLRAQAAYAIVTGPALKTEAARLRTYAALHRSDYFKERFSSAQDKAYLLDRLGLVLKDLMESTELTSIRSTKDYFGALQALSGKGPRIPPGLVEMKLFIDFLHATIKAVKEMPVQEVAIATAQPVQAFAVSGGSARSDKSDRSESHSPYTKSIAGTVNTHSIVASHPRSERVRLIGVVAVLVIGIIVGVVVGKL